MNSLQEFLRENNLHALHSVDGMDVRVYNAANELVAVLTGKELTLASTPKKALKLIKSKLHGGQTN